MTDEARDLLQRAYNALCMAEHELGDVGYTYGAMEFKDRIGEIRFKLGVVAYPQTGLGGP